MLAPALSTTSPLPAILFAIPASSHAVHLLFLSGMLYCANQQRRHAVAGVLPLLVYCPCWCIALPPTSFACPHYSLHSVWASQLAGHWPASIPCVLRMLCFLSPSAQYEVTSELGVGCAHQPHQSRVARACQPVFQRVPLNALLACVRDVALPGGGYWDTGISAAARSQAEALL